MKKQWSEAEVRQLPVRIDVPTCSSVLGIGISHGYVMINNGTYPVEVLRIGRKMVVPTAGLLRLLGLDTSTTVTS